MIFSAAERFAVTSLSFDDAARSRSSNELYVCCKDLCSRLVVSRSTLSLFCASSAEVRASAMSRWSLETSERRLTNSASLRLSTSDRLVSSLVLASSRARS